MSLIKLSTKEKEMITNLINKELNECQFFIDSYYVSIKDKEHHFNTKNRLLTINKKLNDNT